MLGGLVGGQAEIAAAAGDLGMKDQRLVGKDEVADDGMPLARGRGHADAARRVANGVAVDMGQTERQIVVAQGDGGEVGVGAVDEDVVVDADPAGDLEQGLTWIVEEEVSVNLVSILRAVTFAGKAADQ